MKKLWRYLPIVVGLLIADQFFKYWTYYRLPLGADFCILKPVLSWEFYQNPGIAFGIPLPSWFFYTIVIIILISLSYFWRQYYQKKDLISLFALSLIIGGAASNLVDRIRLGYVIDYLNFAFWPVFNLADVMVVGGVMILLVKVVRKPENLKSQNSNLKNAN